MAGIVGLEPTDDGVKVRCLTDLAISQEVNMGWMMGIEPTHAGTTILCLNHLTTPTIFLERKTGVEPATLALARRCSTTEPLPHDLNYHRAYLLKTNVVRVEGLEPPRSPARS